MVGGVRGIPQRDGPVRAATPDYPSCTRIGALNAGKPGGGIVSDHPIFVLGAHRSGTTLLRLILDSHPRIAIPEETGFLRSAANAKTIPGWKHGPGWYHRLGVTDPEFVERLRDFYVPMFEAHAAREGKARWGEKTPLHVWHLDLLEAMFPEARTIGIVRHPAAVVNSLINRWNHGFEEAIHKWVDMNMTILSHGVRVGDRFALCRYEDLVDAPGSVLADLLAFLGEDWDDVVLQHHDEQRAKGAPRAVEGGARPRDPIDPSRAQGWRTMLTRDQLDGIADGVNPLAGFLGYEVHSAEYEPLCAVEQPATGPRVVRGHQIEALRSAHSAEVPEFRPASEIPDELDDLTHDQLQVRLTEAERALSRMRSRRAILVANAFRRLRRARTLGEARSALLDMRVRKYRR